MPVAEPIAIIGMACRFPGAPSLDAYWTMIREGRCAVSEIPESRWDVEAHYDPSGEGIGKMSTRWGAFLEDVDQFDASFFGISPREASHMDPQQRLLLEVAWEALEHAGLSAKSLAGSRTGVFVGIGGTDYAKVPSHYENYFDHLDAYVGTGNALSIAANRLSYVFDFRGPSYAVDTACSSALVALHGAVQSLRNRECDAALAGAVNLILTPEVTIAFSKARMLSSDGVCRPFDKSANGYVRGEGCGLLLIKRLSDAVRDGDNVLAVIRATAINQDGRTAGLTAPNGESQQRVIRASLAQAALDPDQIQYIEAHGTATPLGDPIESLALSKLFRRRSAEQPACYVTSVKANIGHTETVSGLAGLIKTVLLLRHGVIPPQLHLDELNPNLSFAGSRVEVPRAPVPWPAGGATRRIAGISSFGFGGTNAHVIVEESVEVRPEVEANSRPRQILALSAKDDHALRQQAERFCQHMQQHPSLLAGDLCASANVGRNHFNHRLAITGTSTQELAEQLADFSQGRTRPGIAANHFSLSRRIKIAFLFTGQGAQYVGMGRALYDTEPVFREALRECDELLSDRLDESLLAVIMGSASCTGAIDETYFTQPAIFAVEYALARMWISWGLRPDLVLGHSVGEYAAACIAGVFSLRDGIRLIAERGRLMQQLPRDGKMVVIFEAADKIAETLRPVSDRVSIAAINGPLNTVISGEQQTVDRLVADWTDAGIGSQEMVVSHAFHSPLMDPMLAEFREMASEMAFERPRVPVISNLSGRCESAALTDPDYWVRHVRQPVRFADGVQTLIAGQPDVVLEVGPTPQLISMARRIVDGQQGLWLPSMRKGQDDWRVVLDSLAKCYVAGAEVDWCAFESTESQRHVSLPTYPFQRSRHWFDLLAEKRAFAGGQGPLLHPLLGRPVPTVLEKSLYESTLTSSRPKYLHDHRVQGSIVVPAAAYLEIALAAAARAFGPGPHVIESFAVQQAMFLSEVSSRIVQTSLSSEQYGACMVECYSMSGDRAGDAKWTLHARGKVCRGNSVTLDDRSSRRAEVDQIRRDQVDAKSRQEFYELVAARELVYGESFQVLGESVRTHDAAIAMVELPASVRQQLGQYHLHPALLDGCLQVAAQVVPLESDGSYSPFTYMPTRVGRLRVVGDPASATQILVRRNSPSEQTPSPELVVCDIAILDSECKLLVELHEVELTRVGRTRSSATDDDADGWLYQTEWVEGDSGNAKLNDEAPLEHQTCRGSWLILADSHGIGQALAELLESRGANAILHRVADCDPLDQRTYDEMLTGIPEASSLRGIVHLWSLDADEVGRPDPFAAAQRVGCGSVLKMIQSLARHHVDRAATWVITCGAQPIDAGDCDDCDCEASDSACGVFASTLWGLGRVAALEHPELGIGLIDVQPLLSPQQVASEILAELCRESPESQVAYRSGRRFVPRLRRRVDLLVDRLSQQARQLSVPRGTPSRIKLATAGSFEGLRVVPMSRRAPRGSELEIAVRVTGLNFSDVLKTLGLYPGLTDSDIPLGIECAGLVNRIGSEVDRFHVGQEVVAVVPYGFATHVITEEFAVVAKPPRLTFEQAATIPIAFMTAYHALHNLADLQPGERILIHAGAGGVGLAAIQIAQSIGAEIFATAGSESKRDFLRQLGVPHVMNSRTLEFANQTMTITGKEGIDVVLNSLPGEAIDHSLSVLRAYGRFLEIGKTDIYQNRMVGLLPFQDNLSYHAIDLDRMLRQRPEKVRELFADVMRGFDDDRYQPLPLKEFAVEQTRDAFRYMAQRKNIGKVVVSILPGDERDTVTLPEEVDSSRGTYLITGGLGALGRRVATSLSEQGVRHIVLLSRRDPAQDGDETLQMLRAEGVCVRAIQADVCDYDALRHAVASLPDGFPPLRGVVHAAGVLSDGVLYDMSLGTLDKVMRPKVLGAWNLHRLTSHDPEIELVLFSSVSSILGSPGQANYAAGNAFLDALAHHRQATGLRGVAINWGPWAEAGMAVGEGRSSHLASHGMELLPPEPSLDVMHRLLDARVPQTTVMRVKWGELLRSYRANLPPLLVDIAAEIDRESGQQGGSEGVDHEFRLQLQQADVETRVQLLREYFLSQLSFIMGLEGTGIDCDQPLNSIGLDSLMAIELKNQVETRLDLVLPMARFMEGPTVNSLAELVSELLSIDSESPPALAPVGASSASGRAMHGI